MARRRKRNRKRPTRRRSTAARRRATTRTRRSVAKRRAPKRRRRNVARRRATPKRGRGGRFVKSRRAAPKRRKNARRRKPARRRRNALTKKELASYRRAISRYGSKSKRARSTLGRLAVKHRKRNADVYAASMKKSMTVGEIAKGAGMAIVRGGAGFTSSMLVGHFLGQAMGSQYGPLLGNVLVIAASEAAQAKFSQAELLGHSFTAGAAVAAYYNLMDLLVQRGTLTGDLARYLAPWSAPTMVAAPPPIVVNGNGLPANGNGNGVGAVVQQAALYGMGSPIEASMQHRLRMIEQGMSGGIFDSKTTLGEYDIMDSAPAGTFVEQGLAGRGGLAEYQLYPPSMGAAVEQATAGLGRGLREYVSVPLQGMGATVQEAFAGPRGLRDYVNIGDQPPQFWSQTPRGQAILGQIRTAARQLTAQRLASGQPVDAQFKADLTRAAVQAVQGQERDVSMAAPTPPLTEMAAPFPGGAVMDQGGVYGQPAGIVNTAEAMEEDDAGIFA